LILDILLNPKDSQKGGFTYKSMVIKHKIQSQNKKITMGAVLLSSMNIVAYGISNYKK
jgi:hypothetical protein